MAELPTGTVTFLFTDLEGSTRVWEEHRDAMAAAVERHDALLEGAIVRHGGVVFSRGGDGMAAAFGTAQSAVAAAVDAQLALSCEVWGDDTGALRARMGVHTGEGRIVGEQEDQYESHTLNRCARLMAVAHGEQLVISGATAALVRGELPDGGDLVDLGEQRLRDLQSTMHVFQVAAPGLRSSFPPLRSLDALPGNLPRQLNGFVGREQELRDTAGAVGECQLVTLTGVGGVGKTRLALQVAADVLPGFPDGAFLVELGGVNDASAVDETVAAALLVQQQPGQTMTESLLAFLGSKRLLLLLDNCEHLLDAAARLVASVLRVASEVRVLATSREALRLDGERVMTVPSLAVPDDGAKADSEGNTDGVRLFVDRARAIRSEFVLNDENAAAVTQLCRRLDGIPLGIELAAARVRSMAPAEIAARLDQRFRLLTGGNRTAANRHQTLRSAIDWSFTALEPSEQVVLGRLAVCMGGFDLAAAEAIGAGGPVDALDVDDIVGRLVDKSLLLATDRGETTRYKMLETIREYALERLDATGDTEQVRTGHATYYARFAIEAGAGLKGPYERAWLGRVEDELDNLRAAVAWSLASGQTALASTCVTALALPGLRIEPIVASWAQTIGVCDAARADAAFPVAIAVVAWARAHEGRADEATELSRSAVDMLDDTPEQAGIACRVFGHVSGMVPTLGRSPTSSATRWLRAAETLEDDYEIALAYAMVAVGQFMEHDPEAIFTADAGVRAARRAGSPSALAYGLLTAAQVRAEQDPVGALELLNEAQSAAHAAANTFAAMVTSNIRNGLLSRAGQHQAAASAHLDNARDAYQYGRHEFQAVNLFGVAASLAAQVRSEAAAVILGWTDTVLGAHTSSRQLQFHVGEEEGDALVHLADTLGDERYANLKQEGAGMTAEQILDYASQHTTPSGPSQAGPQTS